MYGKLTIVAAGTLLAALAMSSPASALTMKECSTKFQAAKADGSAKDMKWNDFRAKNCGAEAAAADKADEEDVAKTSDKEPAKAAANVVAPQGVTFPKAVDKKYATETPAKQRLHTCSDSYRANKESGTLAGLKWIQKGGGYWSLCNTALKAG
jgi:hypothetical protein